MIDYYFIDKLLPFTGSSRRTIKLVDPDDYEITPRPAFIERQINALQEKINLATRLRDMTVQRYDEEITGYQQQIAELKARLPAKKKEKGV